MILASHLLPSSSVYLTPAVLCPESPKKRKKGSLNNNSDTLIKQNIETNLWKPRFSLLVVFTIGENDDFRKKVRFPYLNRGEKERESQKET